MIDNMNDSMNRQIESSSWKNKVTDTKIYTLRKLANTLQK